MHNSRNGMSTGPVDRLFCEVLSGPRDLGILDDLLSPDYVDHSPAGGASDRTGVRPKLEALRTGFSDVTFTLEATVSEGDVVAARWHWHGTHDGAFTGYGPTGRQVTVRGMDFYRIVSGRICEHWDVVDSAGLLAQIGAPA